MTGHVKYVNANLSIKVNVGHVHEVAFDNEICRTYGCPVNYIGFTPPSTARSED